MTWEEVRINCTYKKGEYPSTVGLIGTVEKRHDFDIGVKIPGRWNLNAESGLFWYKEDEVTYINKTEEEIKMLEKGYVVARVKFVNDCNTTKLYSYALYDDADCVGKLAVTDTDKIVKIHDIWTVDDAKAGGITLPTKELKGIFDDSAYLARIEKAKTRAKIKAEMDERVKKLERDAVYELFAEKDDELRKLLAAYKEL